MCFCGKNNSNNISDEAWDVIKKMPFFRYFKNPVDNASELYERYPDGNEKYSFSYVYNENKFYRWNFDKKQWEPVNGGVKEDPANNPPSEITLSPVELTFDAAGN
jgi:hypothetical protein